MRSAHITRRQAEALLDGLDTDEVFAVQEEEIMRSDVAELERSAEVDRMLEELERELIAAERTEAARLSVTVTDQRSPRRSRRRSDREVLRSLTGKALSANGSGQGKGWLTRAAAMGESEAA